MSDDPSPQTAGPWSARVPPFWLNPATVRGAAFVAAGLAVLALPDLSQELLRWIVAGALVVSGASVVWYEGRRRSARGLLEGVVAVVGGLALALYPATTLRLLLRAGAVYLAARGLVVVFEARRARGDPRRRFHAVRGVLTIAAAIVVFLLPAAVVSGSLAVLAVGAVLLGAIMLGHGISHRDEDGVDLDTASTLEIVKAWLADRDLPEAQREETAAGLFFEPPDRAAKLAAWWVMLLLSVAIATFAIIQDSTAVVIGAMLIAPLMTPIVGAAAAIVNGWSRRLVASLVLIASGVAAAIGLAYIIGTWVPALVPLASNGQVTSRASPNVIDMLIAIAAGAAGAFAIVDKRVSDSIAGVAIAVALVPPLGVVGLTLQAGMTVAALGAFLLFLTNLVSIVLAATVVFFLTGFAPVTRWRQHREELVTTVGTVVVAALLILLPLTWTARGVLAAASTQRTATAVVDEWLGDETTLRVVEISATSGRVEVGVSGDGEVPPVSDLVARLETALGRDVAVEVEYVPTVVYTSDG